MVYIGWKAVFESRYNEAICGKFSDEVSYIPPKAAGRNF